jgi:hypothetical protein
VQILLGRRTENRTLVVGLKVRYFTPKLYAQTLFGTPYGIRTHDLRRERAMSSAARRTVHRNHNYNTTNFTCQSGASGEIRTHESRVLQAPPLDRSGTDAYYLLNIFTNPLPIFFVCHSFLLLKFGGDCWIRTSGSFLTIIFLAGRRIRPDSAKSPWWKAEESNPTRLFIRTWFSRPVAGPSPLHHLP